MSQSVTNTLNQGYRDALLAYYLGQYIPHSGDEELVEMIKTPEDTYEYLLIDPLVSNEVSTSQVSTGISSIQQYINSIILNMEPGYNTQILDQEQVSQWREGANQYALWSAAVELDTYPENYIDPTLRNNKTTYFKGLENTLNQSKINDDTVQNAVLQYLSNFEDVANLDVISGYIDGTNFMDSKYYFIGQERTEPFGYYWRSMDMSQYDTSILPSSAWSEWLPVDLPNNTDSIVGRIRPVIFNNRLYIIWFERTVTGQKEDSSGVMIDVVSITAYSAYCNIDKSWSAPNFLSSISSNNTSVYSTLFTADKSTLNTIALHDMPANANQQNKLTVSLYLADEGRTLSYTNFTVRIDYWFNNKEIEDNYLYTEQADFYGAFIGVDGQSKLQYPRALFGRKLNSLTPGDSLTTFADNNILESLEALTAEKISFDDTGTMLFSTKFTRDSVYYSPQSVNCVSPDDDRVSFDLIINMSYPDAYVSGQIIIDYPLPPDSAISSFELNNQGANILQNSQLNISSDDNKTFLFENVNIPFFNEILQNGMQVSISINLSTAMYTLTSAVFTIAPPDFTWTLKTTSKVWDSTEGNIAHFTSSSIARDYNLLSSSPVGDETLTLYWGIQQDNEGGNYAYKPYTLDITGYTEIMASPSINHSDDTPQGQAQYLAFPDAENPVSNIRLNTLFARELINKASNSIDALLTWETQLTPEPSTDGGAPEVMDFNGANGLYFWELFFHMPFLVAYRLHQEKLYDDSQRWFHFIFDPAARDRSSNETYPEPDYWSVRPLVETSGGSAQGNMVQSPTDPDAIAMAEPEHYQKAVFMAYVNNIIAAGDACYRLLTPDALNMAKLLYCQSKNLLGPRPDVRILNQWYPASLATISGAANPQLNDFEMCLSEPLLQAAGPGCLAQSVMDNPNFIAPLNTRFLKYWDTIDARLYNLRHNLSLDGYPLSLPMYAPPANPTLLMQQNPRSGALSNSIAGLSAAIPPYRFQVMMAHANNAVMTLTQLGQTLLSYYERGDGAGLQEQQQQQALSLVAFTVSLQQQAIDTLNAEQQALLASQSIAQQRYEHYYRLDSEGVSANEKAAMDLQTLASTYLTAAGPLLTAGAALNMAPNTFGLATGGIVWGAALTASGATLEVGGNIEQLLAQRISTSEGYRRRGEEWQLQYQQAQAEVEAINKQLDVLAIRQQSAQTALQQALQEQTNLQSTLDYITTRFTRASLYNWLAGQLSALYYQAYDAVLSLCLSVQACWQYEVGDITSTFIQTSAWNDSYHGLLVGETLQLNLQQMEAAWLSRNTRRLELSKTVSLKQLLDSSAWETLINDGTADFELSEKFFDDDYTGHYLRQLKFVTLSLPALVGPYQDVRVTLTQVSSSTLLKADILGVDYLNGLDTGSAENVITNMRANQQVAFSTGLNDSGLFELSFGDERYLPFEGTGAISKWHLNFPRTNLNPEQRALLDTLNDVILQVHYTAVYGGNSFEAAVEKTLVPLDV
ncbi:hypothetical protein L7E84_004719 [Salmonella enterica]|nr:hypothetical protein [Salmonella enterica]